MSREELLNLVSSLKKAVAARRTNRLGHWNAHAPVAPLPAPSSAPPASTLSVYPPAVSEPAAAAEARRDYATETPDAALRRLLDDEIGDCHRCPLGDTRKKLVFGVGNPRAKVLFIGEGPGFMEDREGEPFVGPAGQLLDKILDAIQLSRKPADPAWRWVYIANVVKCHPMIDASDPEKRGNDRPPSPEEADTCLPFLRKQISIIRPTFIVTLGATSAKTLLQTNRGITAVRGQWFDYAQDGLTPIRLLPTFHPAALLRNPELKKDVWEDMKTLREALKAVAS